jgi:hypothetical protein
MSTPCFSSYCRVLFYFTTIYEKHYLYNVQLEYRLVPCATYLLGRYAYSGIDVQWVHTLLWLSQTHVTSFAEQPLLNAVISLDQTWNAGCLLIDCT